MKLTLERMGSISILTATGSTNLSHARILGAGIEKLASGGRTCVLDITACKVEEEALESFMGFFVMCLAQGASLIVAGQDPRICQVASREEGLKMAGNPVSNVNDDLRVLQAVEKNLLKQAEREESTEIQAMDSSLSDAISENDRLKRAIAAIESQLNLDLERIVTRNRDTEAPSSLLLSDIDRVGRELLAELGYSGAANEFREKEGS